MRVVSARGAGRGAVALVAEAEAGLGRGNREEVVDLAWAGQQEVAVAAEEGQGLAQGMMVPWRRVQRTWRRCLLLPPRQSRPAGLRQQRRSLSRPTLPAHCRFHWGSLGLRWRRWRVGESRSSNLVGVMRRWEIRCCSWGSCMRQRRMRLGRCCKGMRDSITSLPARIRRNAGCKLSCMLRVVHSLGGAAHWHSVYRPDPTCNDWNPTTPLPAYARLPACCLPHTTMRPPYSCPGVVHILSCISVAPGRNAEQLQERLVAWAGGWGATATAGTAMGEAQGSDPGGSGEGGSGRGSGASASGALAEGAVALLQDLGLQPDPRAVQRFLTRARQQGIAQPPSEKEEESTEKSDTEGVSRSSSGDSGAQVGVGTDSDGMLPNTLDVGTLFDQVLDAGLRRYVRGTLLGDALAGKFKSESGGDGASGACGGGAGGAGGVRGECVNPDGDRGQEQGQAAMRGLAAEVERLLQLKLPDIGEA